MTLPVGSGPVSPNTTPRKRTCERWGDGCDATDALWHITPIKTASYGRVARKVTDDHTVSWDGNRWGVPREEVCAGLRGAQVEIERRLDGTHWLRFRGRYLPLIPCPNAPRSASPSGLRPPGLADQNPKPLARIKTKYHVAANHPWRKPWKRTFLSGRNPDVSTLR